MKMPRSTQESSQIVLTTDVLDIYVQFIVLDGRIPVKLQAPPTALHSSHSKAHAELKGID